MKRSITPLRWMLDLVAAACLLVALAYYWTDNTAHEWIGTALFALIVLHNVFNRRWYGRDPTVRRAARGRIDSVRRCRCWPRCSRCSSPV